jgi:hypothetical protein
MCQNVLDPWEFGTDPDPSISSQQFTNPDPTYIIQVPVKIRARFYLMLHQLLNASELKN